MTQNMEKTLRARSAVSQILFCCIPTNYAKSTASAITGERDGTEVDDETEKDRLTFSGDGQGDVQPFNFMNGPMSMLWFRKYVFNTQASIASPIVKAQGDWSDPVAQTAWSSILNGHCAVSKGNLLITGEYDKGNLAVIRMNGDPAYNQIQSYTFPDELKEEDVAYHIEAAAFLGDDLCVLFNGNQGGGYDNYVQGYVVRYAVNSDDGTLTYKDSVRVGKNSFSLNLYGGQLYVPAIGGMQQAGSANEDASVYIVSVNALSKKLVSKKVVLPSGVTGDFRDIAMANGKAYVLTGFYTSDYSKLTGKLYKTPVSNLEAASPEAWTEMQDINQAGYLWGLHAEENKRFWFVKGQRIQVFSDAAAVVPSTVPYRDFTLDKLTDDTSFSQINGACFVAGDTEIRMKGPMGAAAAPAGKSLAGQIRLAREAHMLAEKKKKEIK
jgi:hypothetical protein